MNDCDRKMFGKKINQIRKEQKITSEMLSVMCDVNAVFIRQIESGNRLPSLSVLVKLCIALHVSPSYLLNLEFCDDNLDDWRQVASFEQQKLIHAIIKEIILKE